MVTAQKNGHQQSQRKHRPLWVGWAILAVVAALTSWQYWKGDLSLPGAMFVVGLPMLGWAVALWFRVV